MTDKLKKKLEAVDDMRSEMQVRCLPTCGMIGGASSSVD